ncbi:MAG: hypothetical protein COA43_04715 [Robiginitomaculum sp.]|nr:MAG: hypothetical protein COA43_04715 [Robiginitomaculum sp.]
MINSKNMILVGLSLFALSGCATGLGPMKPVPDLDFEVQRLGPPSTWAFGSVLDQKIANEWQDIILDARLMALINEGLRNNLSLRASAETIARSEAIYQQSRSSLLPRISGNVSGTGSTPLEHAKLSDRYSVGVEASWEVDLWGDIDANINAAAFNLAGAKSFYESARQSFIAQIARAYILAIEARQQQALSDSTLKAQIETHRIVNVRYQLGASGKRELVLAESDIASAYDSVEVANANLRTSIRALQVLLGRYPDGDMDGDMEIPDIFPKVIPFVTAGKPADMLRRRPDIMSAEYGVRAEFSNEGVVRAGQWPSLSLSGGLSSAVSNIGDLFDPSDIILSFGVRIAESIFDGGFTDARISAAEASSRQALKNYGTVVLNAFADVESKLDDVDVVERRFQYVKKSAEAARETLRLAEINYKEGAVDLLDVLTFRQRSFQADRTRLSLERQKIEARISLYLALGGAMPLLE